MPSNNPYSRGYAAIEAAFLAWAPLVALVRPGNQQNMQAPGYVPRPQVQAADRAEFKLRERILPIAPFKNSLQIALSGSYDLEIAAGTFGIDRPNLLVIEAVRALISYGGPTRKLQLDDILSNWSFQPARLTPNDPAAKRPEWTAVMTINLDFSMTLAAFMAATFT